MSQNDGRRAPTAPVVVGIALVVAVALALTLGLAAVDVSASADDGAPESVADAGESAATDVGESAAIDDHGSESDGLDGYAVVQGDRCVPIEPLGDGERTAEEFYDYRHPETDPSAYTYSSHGTTHLQEDDTSILFLHEGSDGLSLFIVHDRLDGDTEGGAATFQIDNLPETGEWVVEDDNYSDELDTRQHEEWEHGDDWSRITWVWSEERTDGGAFNGGLDDEFAVEVTPAFNDNADYRVYDGEVDDWQVLSGSEQDPERTSLEMDEPIELQSGACSAVTDLDVDETPEIGEEVTITAAVENAGDREETVTVPFAVDGDVVDETEVTLAAGENATVSTDVSFEEEGTVTVGVGDVAADVSASEPADDDRLPGFGAVATALAVVTLVLAGAAVRRRTRG